MLNSFIVPKLNNYTSRPCFLLVKINLAVPSLILN